MERTCQGICPIRYGLACKVSGLASIGIKELRSLVVKAAGWNHSFELPYCNTLLSRLEGYLAARGEETVALAVIQLHSMKQSEKRVLLLGPPPYKEGGAWITFDLMLQYMKKIPHLMIQHLDWV